MTSTREWRSGIALALAILLGLAAFSGIQQRHALAAEFSLAEQINCYINQGASGAFQVGTNYCGEAPPTPPSDPSLAEQIICYVDWLLEQTDPDIPFDPQIDYCDPPTPPPAPQCDDGLDNDQDGLIDFPADPGCTSATDDSESPNPSGTGPQCSDGVDNDGDNLVDSADPGCDNPADNDETDGTGGGGGSPQCSDGNDNDQDGQTDFPADPGCSDAQDDDETDASGGSNNNGNGGGNGGGSSRRSSGNNSGGEVLGAAECSEFLTSYIRYGAQNDAEQVSRLQFVLRQFEGALIEQTGVYDAPTLAAVNAFQAKYAGDVLAPWSLKGPTGYVYYTTRKKVNEVFCQGTKGFPLTEAQIEEIVEVSQLNASGVTSAATRTQVRAPASAAPTVQDSIGSQVQLGQPLATSSSAAGATQTNQASTTGNSGGWWSGFWKWLFGL